MIDNEFEIKFQLCNVCDSDFTFTKNYLEKRKIH